MSYKDGIAALNLEMPARVPRTEYSAEFHWDLIKSVTAMDVTEASNDFCKNEARKKFMKAWNYDLVWNILTTSSAFNGFCTKMGHAEYASGGVDFDNAIFCPFKNVEEVLSFDPMEKFGVKDANTLADEYRDHYKKNCADNPDSVNMTGIYITCMSGLIDLFGWDMLLYAAGWDLEEFGHVADRYTLWIQQYFKALADTDIPVVMIHDDIVWTSGAFIHPDWYRKYVFSNYKKLFSPLIESGKKVLYTSDGNYTEFIDDIAGCGVHGFVMEPTTDMKYIADKYGKSHVFIGNADTRILLSGTKEQIYDEVMRCMDIGKKCPGYFMAVGNHIPPNTPVENALYYNEIYEKLSKR